MTQKNPKDPVRRTLGPCKYSYTALLSAWGSKWLRQIVSAQSSCWLTWTMHSMIMETPQLCVLVLLSSSWVAVFHFRVHMDILWCIVHIHGVCICETVALRSCVLLLLLVLLLSLLLCLLLLFSVITTIYMITYIFNYKQYTSIVNHIYTCKYMYVYIYIHSNGHV